MCNNSPAELIGPENGWRLNVRPIPADLREYLNLMCRRAYMYTINHCAKANEESHVLQILVVVANIQTWSWKAEVGGVPCEQQLDLG